MTEVICELCFTRYDSFVIRKRFYVYVLWVARTQRICRIKCIRNSIQFFLISVCWNAFLLLFGINRIIIFMSKHFKWWLFYFSTLAVFSMLFRGTWRVAGSSSAWMGQADESSNICLRLRQLRCIQRRANKQKHTKNTIRMLRMKRHGQRNWHGK